MQDQNQLRFDFFMSPIKHLEDVKETEKTKISIVYHETERISCVLRVCKNRDLSNVCEALCAVQNAHAVTIYDYVYYNGDTYILEENINGQTVADILDEKGYFSEKDTAQIMIAVCKALEDLHGMKPPMVHNDINPSNIKIRQDGTVKLFDFDISRLYKKGQSQNTVLFGTEEFAAPEHYGYGQSEPRTDIYCLGVTMHKMLTGKALSSEHRISYTGKLKKIIKKCLAFDPNNRYTSVVALQKELEGFLSKKRRILGVIFSVVLIGIVILGITLGMERPKSSPEKAELTNPTGVSEENMPEDQKEADASNETHSTGNGETEEPSEPVQHNTRDTALLIQKNQKQMDTCDMDTLNWYQFRTENTSAICRIGVSTTEIYDDMQLPLLNVSVYDSDGIKIEEFNLWSDEGQGTCDLYLESDTQYFIKVSLGDRFETSDYEICVSEIPSDAGIDMESAKELMMHDRYTATLNSVLSDWFVFAAPDDGKYTITVHNIDVGCTIYFSTESGGSAQCSGWAKNEDSGVRTFNAEKDDLVYIEIKSNQAKADGTYIIEIGTEEK